jgi:two-component system nitrogen regulation response regulator GlnG
MTWGDAKILLADDDPSLSLVLNEALRRENYHVETAVTITELLTLISDKNIAVLVCDVMFPDGNALEQMKQIKASRPDLAIIVMSAQSTLLTAVKTREHEVDAYLPKPFPLDDLIRVVGDLMQKKSEKMSFSGRAQLLDPASSSEPTSHENRVWDDLTISDPTADANHKPTGANRSRQNKQDPSPIIGKSRVMQEIYRTIARLMPTDLTVMITGESGSGKEVVARAIHDLGARREQPFVALNMAAIPHDLIESELFGYEKGAFTGADRMVTGRFEQASGGTLFLDEIGDMPIDTQTRLLRVLQDGEFTRVGGRSTIRANTRIIAATHKDLHHQIDNGLFRQDLFYRLNVVPIALPPLRDRPEDIPDLIEHIIDKSQHQGLQAKTFTKPAMESLKRHDWPGNVRELENLVRRLLVLVDDDVIDLKHLKMALAGNGNPNKVDKTSDDQNLSQLISHQIGRFFDAHDGQLPMNGIYDRFMAEVERPLISTTLAVTRGNQLKAAEVLGINRNTLRKKIVALGIDPKATRGEDGLS